MADKPAGIKGHLREIERYRKQTRVLHWVHTGSFIILFLTGLILFVPGLSILAVGGWSRLAHRVAAVVFVVAPAIYVPMNRQATWQGVKGAFSWGRDDLKWFKKMPLTYLLSNKLVIPPRDYMNAGQKAWWLMTLVFGAVFVITGGILWGFRNVAPAQVLLLQWSHIFHDISFIATGVMLFVHIYLSTFAPLVSRGFTGERQSISKDGQNDRES
jgi:formate dehydrogenase subunit gamma